MFLTKIAAFIRLGRLPFLSMGFVLHGLGAAVALASGAGFHPLAFLWGQVAITATQLMTHYSNEYFDQEADLANRTPTDWSGGSRVLVESALLSPAAALFTAAVCIILASGGIILAAAQVPSAALPATVIMFSGLLLSWAYSAPPLQLHSRGLGELTTALVVPGLTTLTGFLLQAGHISLLPVLAALPLMCLQFAMLLCIEFPDAAGDRMAGKRTLVVRLGSAQAARLHNAAVLAAYAILPLLVWLGLPLLVSAVMLAGLPFAGWHLWRMYQDDWANPAQWNTMAFRGVALLMGTALAELGAFLLLTGMTP
jgi:1,4-dihydroxy-2-naphthoate octaprenyltransferase